MSHQHLSTLEVRPFLKILLLWFLVGSRICTLYLVLQGIWTLPYWKLQLPPYIQATQPQTAGEKDM